MVLGMLWIVKRYIKRIFILTDTYFIDAAIAGARDLVMRCNPQTGREGKI
jgi:hypothetical protein